MLQTVPTVQPGIFEGAGTTIPFGQRFTGAEYSGFSRYYSASVIARTLNIISEDLFDSACSLGATSNDTPPQYHRDYYRDFKQRGAAPLPDKHLLDAHKRFRALWIDYEERVPMYLDQEWPVLKTYLSTTRQAPTEADELADFQHAQKYFLQNKEEIVGDYNNKYVAILDNKIVDSDEDFSSLAKRVYAEFGYRAIYMPKATKEEEIIHVPSPHF